MSFGMIRQNWNIKKKLCYMGTDSFNLHIYMNITEDTERRFDTSNSEGERQLPREKIKM